MFNFLLSLSWREKKYYGKNHYNNKYIINTNHTFIQILKENLVKIFLSKEEVFCIKTVISKLEKKTKYTLTRLIC